MRAAPAVQAGSGEWDTQGQRETGAAKLTAEHKLDCVWGALQVLQEPTVDCVPVTLLSTTWDFGHTPPLPTAPSPGPQLWLRLTPASHVTHDWGQLWCPLVPRPDPAQNPCPPRAPPYP